MNEQAMLYQHEFSNSDHCNVVMKEFSKGHYVYNLFWYRKKTCREWKRKYDNVIKHIKWGFWKN